MEVAIMIRGLMVISPNKEDNYEVEMPLDISRAEKHDRYLAKYLSSKNLAVDGMEEMGVYNISTYAASLGFIIFQIDIDNTVVYLPNEITSDQYEWFKKNKRKIRKYHLLIVDLDENQINHYDASNLDSINPFFKYRELMEEKKIISNERTDIYAKNK